MSQLISRRAMVARINRVLDKSGQVLCACREDSRWYASIGPFYIKDVAVNSIAASGISDLNVLAADLGISARIQ